MKYQVNFEKVFTTGILKGRRYHDFLRFADRNSAREFMKKCDGVTEVTPYFGASRYIREYPILSTLE